MCVSVAGRCHYFETTVLVQRLSVPDLSSFTEQTIPVTVAPMSVNVAFCPCIGHSGRVSPRLDGSFSIICMLLPRSRYAKQFRDDTVSAKH